MKKSFIIALVISLMTMGVQAQREVGYRGFFNAGYVLSNTDVSVGTHTAKISNRIAVETIHGYQFCPNLFAGVGVAYHNFHEGDAYSIPVFGDFRYDILPTKVSPFVDAQVGYSLGDWKGFYLNPQVGVRFGLGKKLGLNLSVGYLLQTLENVDGTSGDFTFKVGIDF